MPRLTLSKASAWINANAPRFLIKEWGGASTARSLFFDRDREVEFWYTFHLFRDKIKRNPKRIFNPTKEERAKTWKDSLGVANPMQIRAIREKAQKTTLERYGTKCSLQNEQVKKKSKQTCLKKYGVEHALSSPATQQKVRRTKVENGRIKLYDGKTLREWARDDLNLGSNRSLYRAAKAGLNPLSIKSYGSILEARVKDFLDSRHVVYRHNQKLPEHKALKKDYKRPDFLLLDFLTIIECDGERWHLDKERDEERNQLYSGFGYDVLCLSGKEILYNWDAVKNILENIISKS